MLASLSVVHIAIGLVSLACLCVASYAVGRMPFRAGKAAIETLDNYFHRLFDDTTIPYHDIDADGIIRRVNRAECDLLGYEPEELLGRPVWELAPLEAQSENRNAVLAKLGRRVLLVPFQGSYVDRWGKQITLDMHESLLFDELGRVIGMRSALLAKSSRGRAEAELTESKQKFEDMTNNVPIILWMTGRDGQLEYINHQWLRLTGKTLDQVLGDGWQNSIHPEDLALPLRDKTLIN